MTGRRGYKASGKRVRRTIYGGERNQVSEMASATSRKRILMASANDGALLVGKGKRGRMTSTCNIRPRWGGV
jgi:hypothetical protein